MIELQCVVYQWIRLNELYKLMKSFFQISFENLGQKQKKFKPLILIEVKCIVYQWIRLDKLYKLMESFFQISELFFELVTIFKINSGVGFMHARRKAFVLDSTLSSFCNLWKIT